MRMSAAVMGFQSVRERSQWRVGEAVGRDDDERVVGDLGPVVGVVEGLGSTVVAAGEQRVAVADGDDRVPVTEQQVEASGGAARSPGR